MQLSTSNNYWTDIWTFTQHSLDSRKYWFVIKYSFTSHNAQNNFQPPHDKKEKPLNKKAVENILENDSENWEKNLSVNMVPVEFSFTLGLSSNQKKKKPHGPFQNLLKWGFTKGTYKKKNSVASSKDTLVKGRIWTSGTFRFQVMVDTWFRFF